ncbi:MAG: abortive infection family protein [Bacteroidales bacterium]|nr:abortive infection family protein [Bacteroidales bacterium]
MKNNISPKYQMQLVSEIEEKLWNTFSTSKYKNVAFYIKKWQKVECDQYNNEVWYSFEIVKKEDKNIDLLSTLHGIDGETLLKIAIDLGLETPDLIPSISVFRNELKTNFETARQTFEKAFKLIEDEPDMAIGLVNSALESIIKEISKDERIKTKLNSNKTLYKLASNLLKEFQLFPNSDLPEEIKTIGSSLLSINQSIEKIRSEKTNMHGKMHNDYLINDAIYTYFVVNSVTTIGLFLNSFYKNKFPKEIIEEQTETDNLPF